MNANQLESILGTLRDMQKALASSTEALASSTQASGETIDRITSALVEINRMSLVPQQIEVLKQIYQALTDLKDVAPAGTVDSQTIERLDRVININVPSNTNAQILIRCF